MSKIFSGMDSSDFTGSVVECTTRYSDLNLTMARGEIEIMQTT